MGGYGKPCPVTSGTVFGSSRVNCSSFYMKSSSRTSCGLAGLDWTLGKASLPGEYCSTGASYLGKLQIIYPWRFLSLG